MCVRRQHKRELNNFISFYYLAPKCKKLYNTVKTRKEKDFIHMKLKHGLIFCAMVVDSVCCYGATFTTNNDIKQSAFFSNNNQKISELDASVARKEQNTAETSCGAGKYLSNGFCKECPKGKYCPGGTSGATDCPAISLGTNTVMYTYPASWYPNENLKLVGVSVVDWVAGWKTIADCQAMYTVTNNRGKLRNDNVGYNSSTNKYDIVNDKHNYYLKINPKYYGSVQYYSDNWPYKCRNSMFYKDALPCPDDSFCPGFTNSDSSLNSVSMPSCTNQEYDYSKTTIGIYSNKAISVPAGQYLPANKINPVKCTNSKKYCPGHAYEPSDKDQGIYDCPFDTIANEGKTACVVEINTHDMQYGLDGTKHQCWVEKDIEKYKACIFGVRSKK